MSDVHDDRTSRGFNRCVLTDDGWVEPICNWAGGERIPTNIVLNRIFNQGHYCVCYAVAVAESIRAALNIAKFNAGDHDFVPELSVQDLANNLRTEQECLGYQIAISFEFVSEHGILAAADVPFVGLHPNPPPRPANAVTYRIHDWALIEDDEAAIMEALDHQPVAISIVNHIILDQYSALNTDNGGIINLARVARTRGQKIHHSLLLVGYGVFHSITGRNYNIWIAKDSFGEISGDHGYKYLFRNSSLLPGDQVHLQPMIPIVLDHEGNHFLPEEPQLVEDINLADLIPIASNVHEDVIILFYKPNEVGSLLVKFDRSARLYLLDNNTRIVRVPVNGNWNTCRRFGIVGEEEVAFVVAYKHKVARGRRLEPAPRNLKKDGEIFPIAADGGATLYRMMDFLLEKVGGASL